MTPQRRGLLAIALLVGLLGAITGLATVYAANKSITISPSSGPRSHFINSPGPVEVQTVLHVFGDVADGAPGSIVGPDVYWDSVDPANLVYTDTDGFDTEGNFDVTVEVPTTTNGLEPVRPGPHTIIVCSRGRAACVLSVSGTFTIVKPKVNLSRQSGRPGEAINLSGSRFSPGNLDEMVRVSFGGTVVDESYPSSSEFDVPFDVPAVSPGTYQVVTCNVPYDPPGPACAPKDKVAVTFTVLEPKLNVSPTSGPSGAAFAMTGTGFYAKRALHLFFGPVGAAWNDPSVEEIKPAIGKATDGGGSFGSYDFAPARPSGDYWVTACTFNPISSSGGCAANDTVHAVYTITAPTPTPSPTPKATATPTPSPTSSPTPTPSPTPSLTPSPTPSVSASPSPTLAPTAPPTAAPTAAPTATASAALTAPPTAAPTPTAAPSPTPKAVAWPEHLRTPGQTGSSFDLTTLGGMSLLALLIAFLVPFPGTLFNKTVEANHSEIMGWIAGARRRWNSLLDRSMVGPLGRLRQGTARLMSGRSGVLMFLGLSALVYGFLSPTFGFDTDSLALFLGLLVGLAFVTAAFDLPLRIYHGRTSKAHDRGVLRALWWTLLVAVICVIVSRLANFQPGYLYGLVVAIVFVTEISTRDEGLGTWLASIWLIVLSFVSWVLLAFVRQGAFDPWLSLFLQTVLVTFVVAGIETLAIGLLPMRFLPGHPLYQWRRGMWFVVFALSVMGYLLILVDPANGYLSDDSRTPMIVGVIFLVGFGIVSIGTWAYFRFRPARLGGDRPGEVAAE